MVFVLSRVQSGAARTSAVTMWRVWRAVRAVRDCMLVARGRCLEIYTRCMFECVCVCLSARVYSKTFHRVDLHGT